MPAYRGARESVRFGHHPRLRISFDGDSISATASYGFVAHWMADTATSYPGVATTNLSVAGACIAASENATNNLMGRISNVAGFRPSLHVICIGTNDLASIDANTTFSRLTDYVRQLRQAVPGIKIAACGVGPCGPSSTSGHNLVNGRRGSYNSQLRAAVGTLLDAYIPRGEHPIYDVDSAAQNTTWWNADQIHPLQIPCRAYFQMLHDVLDPYIEQACNRATVPTLSFPSLFNYAPSTAATMRARVTGLGFGRSATLSVSGGPSTSIGIGSFDTTGKVLMNGDVPQIQLTSSATASTLLSGTYTFSGSSSSWGVTTQPASWPAVTTTLDSAHKASTVTLSGTPPLTATAGSGGANQLAMSTAPAANDWTYFEAAMGVAGDTANGKKISIHDASLISHYNSLPGLSAGYTNAGLSIAGGTNATVYAGGVTYTAIDFINSPALASGTTIGVLLHRPTGKMWLQSASGTYWPGDPTVLDGGIQITASLAQFYCDLVVQTNAQGATINYGATAFAYTLPTGFAPHG